MKEKTVFRDRVWRRPGEQMRSENDELRLEPCAVDPDTKSVAQEESVGDRRTRIARGLSNHRGDHKKLAEKVFNLVISSGEILINLTPDR